MNKFKRFLPFIIILSLSFFAFKPLLSSGFFPIHDDAQVARVYEMIKALKDGMFPVRWVADLGYGFGYPIFNFYNPFPYYIAGFFGLLGADALLATKLIMIIGIIISGFSMYVLAKEFWGRLGGILSSLFYVYAPYHAVDIYIRGDVTEFWAYALIPLVFYGLWKIYKENKWRYIVITSLSFALIIISHNLTAMMVSPFILALTVYLSLRKKTTLFSFFISLFIGLLISAFYSLPVFWEMRYTNVLSQIGGGADFRDHFVCLSQLWTSIWGYGGSSKGCISDGFSFMIGKYHIFLSVVLFLFSVISLFSHKFIKIFEKEKLAAAIAAFVGTVISVFFTLSISKPIWEIFVPMSFFQYPWRFLIMITFFSSFISGASLWIIGKFIKNKKIYYILGLLFMVGIITVSTKFFVPQKNLQVNSNDYISDYMLKWRTSKISDEYMPKNFQRPTSSQEIADILGLNSDSLIVISSQQKTHQLALKIVAQTDVSKVLPIAYFPSWKGYIDGESLMLNEENGKISINLPEGKHDVELRFSQTPVQKLSNILSVAGILALFIGIIHYKKKYE